jgi:hypothetical protein
VAQIVPERIYRTVLKDGFTWVEQNLTRMDSMFLGYSDESIAQIKLLFTEAGNLHVVRGWPRGATPKFPCVAIVLHQETSIGFIGETIGSSDVTEVDGGLQQGGLWTATHMLMCVSDNEDITLFLYYLVKMLMQRGISELIGMEALHSLNFEGGDLTPEFAFLPDHMYIRALTVRAEYYDSFQQDFEGPIAGVSVVIDHSEIVP